MLSSFLPMPSSLSTPITPPLTNPSAESYMSFDASCACTVTSRCTGEIDLGCLRCLRCSLFVSMDTASPWKMTSPEIAAQRLLENGRKTAVQTFGSSALASSYMKKVSVSKLEMKGASSRLQHHP